MQCSTAGSGDVHPNPLNAAFYKSKFSLISSVYDIAGSLLLHVECGPVLYIVENGVKLNRK